MKKILLVLMVILSCFSIIAENTSSVQVTAFVRGNTEYSPVFSVVTFSSIGSGTSLLNSDINTLAYQILEDIVTLDLDLVQAEDVLYNGLVTISVSATEFINADDGTSTDRPKLSNISTNNTIDGIKVRNEGNNFLMRYTGQRVIKSYVISKFTFTWNKNNLNVENGDYTTVLTFTYMMQ